LLTGKWPCSQTSDYVAAIYYTSIDLTDGFLSSSQDGRLPPNSKIPGTLSFISLSRHDCNSCFLHLGCVFVNRLSARPAAKMEAPPGKSE
jgi:hypothetical protein